MRRSREEAAATRDRIVEVASRLFRERGVDGVGVAEVMQQAGLTHGGFYKHFPSKDALVAEACARELTQSMAALAREADRADRGERLKVILERYLTTRHRDNPGLGCTLTALAGEAVRREGDTRHAVSEGALRLIETVADRVGVADGQRQECDARAVAAAMVGAIVLARTIEDPELSEAVLRDTQAFILRAVD